jgi:hypothetical protein
LRLLLHSPALHLHLTASSTPTIAFASFPSNGLSLLHRWRRRAETIDVRELRRPRVLRGSENAEDQLLPYIRGLRDDGRTDSTPRMH